VVSAPKFKEGSEMPANTTSSNRLPLAAMAILAALVALFIAFATGGLWSIGP
jgi:hypothetical protein